MCRLARYHCASYSGLLQEYDMAPIKVDSNAQHAAPRSASSNCCECRDPVAGCFFGELHTMGDGSYASPSPQSLKLVGLA